jgi:uncharacterized protein
LIILSTIHAAPLLAARKTGATTARVSPDLGLTVVEVRLEPDGARFPQDKVVPWRTLNVISRTDRRSKEGAGAPCFAIQEGEAERISVFSERTGRVSSLVATQGAPTIMLAGFAMHRTKGVDPLQDTVLKVRTVSHVRGRVLDTTTGLGYTAIEAAKTASGVVTVELDPAVLAVAKVNPWSRTLFDSKAIMQLVGDSAEVVMRLENESFSCVIHDPPTISLAGDLYAGDFYRELYRVLKRGGRLYHYVGDLNSGLGRRVAGGVVRRLLNAGFSRVRNRPEAFGVLAIK